MRIAVIGLGGTGAAAAHFLASAGHEVHGFEQGRIGNTLGSSHGESRIIRYTYPDPLYTRLMGEAYPLWHDLDRASRDPLIVRCGGLFVGPRDHPELAAIASSLDEGGHPYDMLDPAACRARFPAMRLAAGEAAIYQADSGFLRATDCVRANARLARAHGAHLHEDTRVVALHASGSSVTLEIAPAGSGETETAGAGRDRVQCDAAIVAAGPWVGRLLDALQLPLVVTRQQLVYFRIGTNPELFVPERFPVWIDAATYDYGFPIDGRIAGVKVGFHRQGTVVHPSAPRPPVEEAFIRERFAYVARRFPDLTSDVLHEQVCLYTNTPDEDFIVDEAPGLPGVWIVSGCSGHGFKFTVLLGRIAADLATGAGPARDLSRFSLDRFSPV